MQTIIGRHYQTSCRMVYRRHTTVKQQLDTSKILQTSLSYIPAIVVVAKVAAYCRAIKFGWALT